MYELWLGMYELWLGIDVMLCEHNLPEHAGVTLGTRQRSNR
jgi:hypothetical protein